MCGDHGKSKADQQLQQQNQLQQQQLAAQTALRNQEMGNPNVRGSIASMLAGGVGFDPATMAAMQSQFLNQNTANFNQAGSAVRSALASRGAGGGDLPVGGDFVRGIASLEGAKANSQANGILGLNIQNAQQALNNQFNAANVASGQTAQLGNNIGVFGQGANNSLDQYVKAASTPGFMSAFGSALGQGLGIGATGAFGGILQSVGLPKSITGSFGTKAG